MHRFSPGQKIVVHDLMQKGYTYTLVSPIGKDFDSEFKPEVTPKEMLELGVFGGKYMTDCTDEFPKQWFSNARLCHEKHDPTLNFFKVNASQSLKEWQKKGWIHPDDPRGWFQWYCRYFVGRRIPSEDKRRIPSEDKRQIQRWKGIKRHIAQVKKNCIRGDFSCRSVQRQALLHWAYDSRLL